MNNLKASIGSLCIFLAIVSNGQQSDTFVKVSGKVLSSSDSSEVMADLFYEKLPYYDDMGMSKSGTDGTYEFMLTDQTKYTFRLSGKGFIETNQEFLVEDSDSDGQMSMTLYINPVAEEVLPELISLENLIFSRGSDRISDESFGELDELAIYLEDNSTMIIQLEGHTDFAGNPDANMRLSQARVEAIKNYLVDKGTKKNRILTKAFGGTAPLFTERTPEAKTKNRRVEVRILSR